MKRIGIYGEPHQLDSVLDYFKLDSKFTLIGPDRVRKEKNDFVYIERNNLVSTASKGSFKDKWIEEEYHLPQEFSRVLNLEPNKVDLSKVADRKYFISKDGDLCRVSSAGFVRGKTRINVTYTNLATGEYNSEGNWLWNIPNFIDSPKISMELKDIAIDKLGRGHNLTDFAYDPIDDTLYYLEHISKEDSVLYQHGNWKGEHFEDYEVIVKDLNGYIIAGKKMSKSQLRNTINDNEILEKINE